MARVATRVEVRVRAPVPVLRMKRSLITLWSLLMLLSTTVPASPAVPEPLAPWVEWVAEKVPERDCPFLQAAGQRACLWVNAVELRLTDEGGDFVLAGQAHAEAWLLLPGSREHWPHRVQLNGAEAILLEQQGYPALRIPAGAFVVRGSYAWGRLPNALPLPPLAGLVRLTIDGVPVPVNRDAQGRLWLRDRAPAATADTVDRLDLRVHRKISDLSPMRVDTQLVLDVAGRQREAVLPAPLLAGFIPIALESPLPARLEGDGGLRVQLRPGSWTITVAAYRPGEITRLSVPAPGPDWPGQEVWAFEAQHQLRLVEPTGLARVDPRQTSLPPAWHRLPAFLAEPGQTLTLEVRRRGDSQPEPDTLSLVRRLWLDFDGGGYTVQDRLTGTITRTWRLEASPDLALGRVSVDGQDQLITQRAASGNRGVEVRRGDLRLTADSRYEGPRDLVPVGWRHDLNGLSATLYLPPGWEVLAVAGVDNDPPSWLQRWTLLDLFLVLIAGVAVARLWGAAAGAVALLALALTWHAPGAPQQVWLHLIGALALLRVVPAGRLRWLVAGYRNLALLVLILVAIPFLVGQARTALYPQLTEGGHPAPLEEAAAPAVAAARSIAGGGSAKTDEAVLSAQGPALPSLGGVNTALDYRRIDPSAAVQTGPGLPRWRWRQLTLGWNGPVAQDQSVSLTLLSPSQNRVLHLLRILLLLALAVLLIRDREKGGPGSWLQALRLRRGSLLLLLLLTMPFAPPAVAGFPSPALLEELRARLSEPPECQPACAAIQSMSLRLGADRWEMRLEVHAQASVGIPLPAADGQWWPNEVRMADADASAVLLRDAEGTLWLLAPKGRQEVTLKGPAPLRSQVDLPLPLRPARVIDAGEPTDWVIGGVNPDGVPQGALSLVRRQAAAGDDSRQTLEPGTLPPLLKVTRTLQLGLDWRVLTQVRRLSPVGSPLSLDLPLIDGEAVTTAGIEVADGSARIHLAADADRVDFSARLAPGDRISLTAPTDVRWTEEWRLDVAPLWHLDYQGIPVIHHQDGQGAWLPTFAPWPGESVSLQVGRPAAVPGRQLTIDRSSLAVSPGRRAVDSTLTLEIRASQGGQHRVRLPEGADLRRVSIDDKTQPVRQQGRDVVLPIRPGTQAFTLAWRHEQPVGVWFETPAVDLGVPSVNHEITVTPGRERWTLATFGPVLGPAVLFWSTLSVVVLIAVGLGRSGLTPLKTRQWVLLGIGLTQLDVIGAGLIVAWLLALGARERMAARDRPLHHDLLQLGLAVLTLVALSALFEAVSRGLLGYPSMQIEGNNSHAYRLNWYQDRVAAVPGQASIVSVPLWVYRGAMLFWALWLAFSLLRWLKWGWGVYVRDGLWRRIEWRPLRRWRRPVADAGGAPRE